MVVINLAHWLLLPAFLLCCCMKSVCSPFPEVAQFDHRWKSKTCKLNILDEEKEGAGWTNLQRKIPNHVKSLAESRHIAEEILTQLASGERKLKVTAVKCASSKKSHEYNFSECVLNFQQFIGFSYFLEMP